jgi:hypothetical protein
MKLPGKVRSIIDEMEGLSSSDKAKVLRHLNDMADSLPEHPTPAEAQRIVKGALKKVGVGAKKKEEAPEEKEEKEEKPKKEKETVKESLSKKVSFKAFLNEFAHGDFDAATSEKAAQKVQDLLDSRFHGYFDYKRNSDGSVTFTQSTMAANHDEGNGYVLSPQNLSKLIGPMMDLFRKEGWTFTQPVSRKFIIGLPAGADLNKIK